MHTENSEGQKPVSGSLGIFDTQAHRGGRGLMPENTVPAMLNALRFGVITLEMDVVVTKDKQVVLSHEPFFNHELATMPNGSLVTQAEEKSLNIFQMNYDEVKKFDVGLRPHPRFKQQEKLAVIKPLLSDVFDAVKNQMVNPKRPYPFFNIETKCQPSTDNLYHPEPAEFVDLLMAVIKEKEMEKYVLLQSFDFRTLQYLHKNYPSIATAMLIEDSDKLSFEDQLTKIGFTANVYSPHYSLVNEELVKKCHQNRMRIIPWTVNDKKTIEKLKAMGVDGIISDYPNLFGNGGQR